MLLPLIILTCVLPSSSDLDLMGFPELKATCTSLFSIAVSGLFLNEFVQLFSFIYPFGSKLLVAMSYTIKLCLFALF